MKPLIGITTYFVDKNEMNGKRVRGINDQDMVMSTMDYSRSVQSAGGIPVAIPAIIDKKYINDVLDKLDGLVLSGGGDVHPMNYGHDVKDGLGKVEDRRDDFELLLLDGAIKKKISIMGICRGFHLINVYFGGTLIQDIPSYYNTEINHVGPLENSSSQVHSIRLNDGEILNELYGKHELRVNSYHHQMIDSLGVGLKVTAESEDGIIEGISHNEIPNIFAVQWHPEMMTEEHIEHNAVFHYLINKTNNK